MDSSSSPSQGLLTGLITINGALLVIGSYAAFSTFFYFFPGIIHKKPSKNFTFAVMSHRGGSAERTENTIEAFENSRELGVDVIEFDCQITKDGKVVVSHDNNLSRLAGVNRLISDLNYNELPQLLENSYTELFSTKPINRQDSSESQTLINRNGNSNTLRRIPLLENVFEKFPDMRINLDIKVDNDELIRKVNELIVKYKREKITVWGSFSESVTQKCLKLNPSIEAYFSLRGCVKLLTLMCTGLLPFWPLKEKYLEILMPNFLLKHRSLPIGITLGCYLIRTAFIRKSIITHLQKRGIYVYLWVLNSEEEFQYALDIGANGIITDYPLRLIQFIENNPEYKTKLVRPEKL